MNFICNNCGVKYIKKNSYETHKTLCNFKMKTAAEQITELEMPNHLELVKLIKMLTAKTMKMEEEMIEMKKWINKKKRQINVLQWLNINVKDVDCFFEDWSKELNIEQEDFIYLLENKELNISRTIQRIFENNITNDWTNDYSTSGGSCIPIKCFTEKSNMFYVYLKNVDNDSGYWKQMETKDVIFLLKQIQTKLMTELIHWKSKNQHNIDENDTLSALFNKSILKLIDLNLTENTATLGIIKKNLYNYIKTDFNSMIEYEF